MKFTENQLRDFFYEEKVDVIHVESDNSYRHGTYETYVIPYEDKHYMITLSRHHEEGLEIWGDVDAVEVEKREITVEQWVKLGKKVSKKG